MLAKGNIIEWFLRLEAGFLTFRPVHSDARTEDTDDKVWESMW